MTHPWLASRTASFDSSGIRKVFDLAARLENPINLSIGQPDFAVPDAIKEAAITAIRADQNGYSPTQGIGPLREHIQQRVDKQWGHADRRVLVTSGTSGALVLLMLALVEPGDEVLIFDPYFVMYNALVKMVGGTPVFVDTYPDFRIDAERVRAAITPRTKMILFNSPGNPTGVVATEREARDVAALAAEHQIVLVSDEIYRFFAYDTVPSSPVAYYDQTFVIDGYSKSYGMTGWRLGYVHGPAAVIDKMTMIQQYSFVCAPQPFQWAALAAEDVDLSDTVDAYRRRRDRLVDGLAKHFEVGHPDGAFYAFVKAPWGTGTQFVEAAIRESLLIIPGGIFSRRDTHFRISYAASEATIDRGIEVLCRLAEQGPA